MNRSQLLSQALGISLAITTAVGCLAYERLVNAYPYFFVGFLVSLSYVPFWVGAFLMKQPEKLPSIWENRWALFLFLLSGVTAPIWYYITKKQGMMVSSTYEIKYVVVLGIFYFWFGEHRITLSMGLGILFAIASVYCLSKAN